MARSDHEPDRPEHRESAASEFLRGDYALAAEAEARQQNGTSDTRPYPERRRQRRRWSARRLGTG